MTPVSVHVGINKIDPASPYRNITTGVVLRGFITGYQVAVLLMSQEATPKIEAQSMQEEPVPKQREKTGGRLG